MKVVKVKLLIDVECKEQVQALNDLFIVIQKSEINKIIPSTNSITVSTKEEKESPVKKTKTSGTKKQKTAPETVPETAPETAPEAAPEAAPETAISLKDIRKILSTKSEKHRPVIKAKLTELGAPNIPQLDTAKYPEFVEFLKTLD